MCMINFNYFFKYFDVIYLVILFENLPLHKIMYIIQTLI